MKIALPIVAVWLALGAASSATADQIVIVQSAQLPPFEEAIQGFKRTLEASVAHRGPKKVQAIGFRTLPLQDQDTNSPLAQRVRSLEPDLILAVGSPALNQLRDLREIPIVYLLVHTPAEWLRERSNITGVKMTIPPERWFETIRTALPDVTRLGILYDPDRTGEFVGEATAIADPNGLSLVTQAVASPKEVYSRLRGLRGQIDAIWMLPDPGVVTPQTLEALLLFSLREHVPIITFSQRYLDKGATVALLLDFDAMGRQAGEIALRLLDGTRIEEVPPELPAKLHLRVNRTVAERLGIASNLPPESHDEPAR